MDEHRINPGEDDHLLESPETPEDVAVLYTWANVHGGKYRDFSASRREYKAQQRHRMAEEQRKAELEAAREREEAAVRELEEARRNEVEAAHDEELRMLAEDARRRAEERAERERLEAQRHVETAENLKRAMEEAQREMEEARRRVQEQEARYAEADARYRASGRPQLPGEIDDPYYFAGHLEPGAFAPGKGVRSSVPQRVSSERRIAETYYKSRGSEELPSAQERDPHGMFSSGVRRRASGARSPYIESDSQPQAFVPPPIDTPEDVRERLRPDEQERLYRRQEPETNGGMEDDDGYYDHRMDRKSSSPARSVVPPGPSDLNSVPGDVYIAPRTPQARSVSEERKITRSEDPAPGNTHILENSRVRRRDSVTDVSARTVRHPRQERSQASGTHAETRPNVSSGATPAYSAESYDAMRRLPADRRWLDSAATAARRQDSATIPSRREEQSTAPKGQEGRPEWLVRETHPSVSPEERSRPQQQVEEQSSARSSRTYDERNVRSREEQSGRPSGRSGQFVPAPDGGFNLAPLPDAPPVSRAESRPRSKSVPRTLSAYPASEQRRVERSSGDGLTREARVAPPTPAPPPAPVSERRPVAAEPVASPAPRPSSGPPSSDTLQQSRERVAARWFALKGLVGSGPEAPAEATPAARPRETQVPTLCVLSLSGGVGKTSMVATIGRTLSAMGERVLLADATPHGLLPYYFGAHELRPDVVRTFSPPPESKDAPVFMVNYEAERLSRDEAGQTALLEEMTRHAHGTQRILLDLNNGSAWLGRRLAQMHAKILVPVTPDMNSVLGIRAVERFFAGSQDAEGRPVRPYYVLNQFDASLPLHLDVREVLRQQLEDRLLPVMIRRSPAVAEALAEGMTVMDYAPESPIAEDYTHLAEWVRNLAAPAQNSMRATRWSER
jgi:cellulose synthase operon protein YhjQ